MLQRAGCDVTANDLAGIDSDAVRSRREETGANTGRSLRSVSGPP